MLGSVNLSKLDKIKSGTKTKEQVGGSQSRKMVSGKGGNYTVTEKETKFEESGGARKKKNNVMYESKLGTEKEKNVFKHDTPRPKPKPKPKAQPKPRQEEKIIQKKKKKEYLDNYQYHETKDIRENNPNKVSIVTHQRLGDIIGGSYEESSTTRYTMSDSGSGPKLYSTSSTKTSVKRDARGVPTSSSTLRSATSSSSSTVRSNAGSRTLPATSRSLRTEVKQYSSSTSYGKRGGATQPATTTRTSSSRVASRSSGGSSGGVVKSSTRTYSAGRRS